MKIAKYRGNKRKGAAKQKKDPSIDALISSIKRIAGKNVFPAGDYTKVSKNFKGPGYYFIKSNGNTNHTIDLVVTGSRMAGVGFPVIVNPGVHRYDYVLQKLIEFRLDGYGSGIITEDSDVKKIINSITKNANYVSYVEQKGLRTRSSVWGGPGCYEVKPLNGNGYLEVLVVGAKKPGIGVILGVYPRQKHEDLYYDLSKGDLARLA